MRITRKFYSRYGEARKHVRFVDRLTPMTSKSFAADEAVMLRLDGSQCQGIQLISMTSAEARHLAAQLTTYADIADLARDKDTPNPLGILMGTWEDEGGENGFAGV